MNDQFESTVEGDDSQAATTAPELEIVEGKEGPNSEVVYKYQDEYFYVDREQKKVVKAKESELQDAKHEVIVKDAEQSTDENASSSNRSQSEDNTESPNNNSDQK